MIRVGRRYTYNTYLLAKSTANTIADQGGKTWYMIAVDYRFGQVMIKDVSHVLKQKGGSIVGSNKHPLNSPDFSSYLLQAQGSKAQVIGLANAVNDIPGIGTTVPLRFGSKTSGT
jgi:branched-chain amino acid transport system substrate-binding protein